ncbi:hypothetical protein PF008_g8689 [Phytophthora fragariae]|nr:hypothetical protein PF008_g8689 [Phytophthora fragariae]
METTLFQAIRARAEGLGVDVKVLVQHHDPMLDDTAIKRKANSILRRIRNDGSCVQPTWTWNFQRRHGLLPDQEVAVTVITGAAEAGRIPFTSADDIFLPKQAVDTKPWQVECALDGWEEVASQLR